jgi:hypothetical protein
MGGEAKRGRAGESGQASVEFVGLLLLIALALAAALAFAPVADGRPLGAAIARALVCAVRGDCRSDDALRVAYGDHDAALVRDHMPNLVYEARTLTLPVDYRECRSHRCSDAPDDRDLDVHRSHNGKQATAFTHVIRRGGRTYIQYWFYYPDSPSTFAGSHAIWEKVIKPITGRSDPADHPDDWEGYQVRIDPGGDAWVRATKHGGYTWCKGYIWHTNCERWGPQTGWTRISRGSHAGHIPDMTPGNGLHERSTTASGIKLVPLETLDHHTYRPQRGGIKPPWTKTVYGNPEADSS